VSSTRRSAPTSTCCLEGGAAPRRPHLLFDRLDPAQLERARRAVPEPANTRSRYSSDCSVWRRPLAAPSVTTTTGRVSEFDPTAGLRFATLDEMATDSLQRERLMANLSGFFGGIAIVLAAVGVYGVVAYAAASRRLEIGIRLALGARGTDVLRALLGRVALVIGVGLALGLALAIPANAAAASLLYGIDPREPWAIALIVGLMAASGLLAALVPARRAMHTDPVTALRAE
jgi:ABC-type lipoprotein release transport system permease subunit